jgi:hypothetical protein
LASTTLATTSERGRLKTLFSFPDPVNEVSARLVAGGVVILAAATLVSQQHWLVYVMVGGFLARVLTGPSLSPLGQFVTRVITPRLPVAPKPVPGPPKRFAQLIGASFTASASILTALGYWTAAEILVGFIIVAATLESVFAYCLGCKAFGLLMRAGVIPEEVCARCNDINMGRA